MYVIMLIKNELEFSFWYNANQARWAIHINKYTNI